MEDNLIREVYVDIDHVLVEENEARFSGECTYDSAGSNEGCMFFMYVMDEGTPAIDGDTVKWSWDTDAYVSKTPISGNVVVHYNETED